MILQLLTMVRLFTLLIMSDIYCHVRLVMNLFKCTHNYSWDHSGLYAWWLVASSYPGVLIDCGTLVYQDDEKKKEAIENH